MKRLIIAACLACSGLVASVSSARDFSSDWAAVKEADAKGLPRTATNILARIEKDAIAAEAWPDVADAFVCLEYARRSVDDDMPETSLARLASAVESAPPQIRGVLHLFLARAYRTESERWRWGGRRPTKLDGEAAEGKMPPWSPERINDTLESEFAKVLEHADSLKAAKTADWAGFWNRHESMKGAGAKAGMEYAPTLYDVAIRDMIGFYGRTIPDDTLEKGLALYDRLIEFHKDDANPAARLMAELGRARYERDFEKTPQKERDAKFEKFLDGFILRNEGVSETVAEAAWEKANLMSNRDDFVGAHDLAEAYAKKYPNTHGGDVCASYAKSIEQAELDCIAERTWCDPLVEIEVSAKNLDAVEFKLVEISFEEVEELELNSNQWGWKTSAAKRDDLLKRAPAKSWTEKLVHERDYKTKEYSFKIPSGLKNGYYILYAATNDKFGSDGLPLLAQFVTVTPLALVTEIGNGEFKGRVLMADSGLPVPDAMVELWGSSKKNKGGNVLQETLKTDEEGRFSASLAPRDMRNIRVVSDKGEVLSLGTASSGWQDHAKRRNRFVDINTDRAIYRPGQKIHVKGIAYMADSGKREFTTLQDETVGVSLLDVHSKVVSEQKVRTNKWGSFAVEFTAPVDRLTGDYVIRTELTFGWTNEEYVRIEEYKRPKFSVQLTDVPSDAALGREAVVSGKAMTYSGLPVQNAKVTWCVSRTVRYPYWWRWCCGGVIQEDEDEDEPSFAKGTASTDENGVFKLAFTPQASPTADLAGDPSFIFVIDADVVDGTGETRSAERRLEVGTVAWRATVGAEGSWHVAGGETEVDVSLKSLDGAPVSAKGLLKVLRLKMPEKPKRKELNTLYMDEEDRSWNNWEAGEEVESIDVETDAKGAWKSSVKLPAGAYRLEFETKDPGGKRVRGLENFLVFDPDGEKFAVPVPDILVGEKAIVRVGEKARWYWGSGYDKGRCLVRVSCNGKLLREFFTQNDSPSCLYEMDVGEEHRGRLKLETFYLRENRFYKHADAVDVPWDNKHLKIEATHITKKLEPKNEESWRFKVSGPAEVLALMYDKSLDAFKPHYVGTTFYSWFSPQSYRYDSFMFCNCKLYLYRIAGFHRFYEQVNPIEWPSFCGVGNPLAKNRGLMACGMIGDFAPAKGMRYLASAPQNAEDACFDECEEPEEVCAVCADGGFACSDSGGDGEADSAKRPRKNFDETAFFYPNLETDGDGNVSFSFTVPDAVTGWKLLMVAHDNELRSGLFECDDIVTTKPLMCEANPPRFATEGDLFQLPVKVTNTTDEKRHFTVALRLEGIFPFSVNNTVLAELEPHESQTFDFLPVRVQDGARRVEYSVEVKGEGFSDCEQGAFDILPRSVLVREAVQLNLRGTGTKKFQLKNLLDSNSSDTIRHRDLTVSVVSRPAWLAVMSLAELMETQSVCSERVFSQYYANAVRDYIVNANPKVREVMGDVRPGGAETSLEKLRELQNSDGLWPWCPGGSSSTHMTLYILTGFARLERMTGAKRPDFFNRGVAALDEVVSHDVKNRLARAKERKEKVHVGESDVRWLYLHSFDGVSKPRDGEAAAVIADRLREEWSNLGLDAQSLAAVALSRMGEKGLAREIMASIKERAIVSDEMGMYWKTPYFYSSSIFAAPVSTHAHVVEAFREVTLDAQSADLCNVWILKQRQTRGWATTPATVDAVYALIMGGGPDLLTGETFAEVRLGGVKVPTTNSVAEVGMYTFGYDAREVKPEMGEIEFSNAATNGVAWGGVHWSYYEDVLKVRAHEPKELRVEKKYYKKVHGADGTRLVNVDDALEQGDEIVARLEITSDRTYEFVHLEDARPACAEPEDVVSSYRWRDGLGYYQSTLDTATHYYIDRINRGRFVIETSYRVQQRGVFSGGIATIECLYAPEFTAHSGADRISVR